MKNTVNIMIKVIHYNIFVLVFLLLSGCGRNHNDRNVSGKDSTYLESMKGKTYNERLAEHTYEKYCAVCHGIEGRGDGFNSYNLEPRPTDFTNVKYMNALSYEHLVQTISEGGRGINKSPLMPAWGNTLTSDEVQRVATYVGNFSTEPQDD